MERLVKTADFFDRLVTRAGKLAAWTAVLLMLVIIWDVVTRRFLVLGSTRLQELEWHIHTVLFAFCLGFGYVKDSHVRIELLRERLSRRLQWWIELLGVVFFLIPYCAIVLYFSVDWWYRSFEILEGSDSATGLPGRWIIKAALPLGFAFLLLAGITVLLRRIVELFGPPGLRELVTAAEEDEVEHLDQVKSEIPR